MIPSPWVAAILVFATFRLIRLVSYDAFPPIARLRAWIIGEHETTTGTLADRQGLTANGPRLDVSYRRPILAELFHCVYCMGAWLSLGVYVFWVWQPTLTLYACAVFALNAAAALIARWLDP